ncbi:hypothetical protein C100_08070 [Sphingobium sp. C100]|nr:hypothetical protein C100_08070 [Sphingobium sp. C100]
MSGGILEFCREISSERPVFVRSKPSADAQQSACFDNVARKIARAGGETAFGWAIWHVPGLYFEAEHHGVWRNRQGNLLDVSPQLGQVAKLLFLPDANAVYEPKRFRPNLLKPVDDSALAVEFVALARQRNAIMDAYRTDEYVVAMLSGLDQARLGEIEMSLKQLWAIAGVRI